MRSRSWSTPAMMARPMTPDTFIHIDDARFWSTVMRSGDIGPGKAGGLFPLALSDADKEMRGLFVPRGTQGRCTRTLHKGGEGFAPRPGAGGHLAPGVVGSHPAHPGAGRG